MSVEYNRRQPANSGLSPLPHFLPDRRDMTALVFLLAVSATFSSVPQQSTAPLKQTDVNQIIGAVLTQVDVAKYLHPDTLGRVPVKIAIAAPYSNTRVALVLYRKPVAVVVGAADAVNFKIAATVDGAKVQVSYRPEGMVGTVLLRKSQNRWIASSASIHEH